MLHTMGLRSSALSRLVALVSIVWFALLLGACGSASLGAPPPPAYAATPEAPPAEPAAEDALYAKESSGDMRRGEAVAQAAGAAAPPARQAPAKPDAASTPEAKPDGVATGGKGQVAGPMLIYRATINMAVFETRKAIDAVEKLAKDSGGYLVSREDTRITVRVPATKFDGTLDKVAKLGDLLHRNVNVQDVTAEYTDLSIRMRNLEVMRTRLEELLQKANKVEDALAVERELERVTSELERLKGRLKLLAELVSFSTITVEFQPRPVDHVDSKVHLPFPWLDQLGLGELLRL